MKKSEVVYSKEAVNDLQNLSGVIMYKYKAPLTAVRYLNGLQNETSHEIIFLTHQNDYRRVPCDN